MPKWSRCMSRLYPETGVQCKMDFGTLWNDQKSISHSSSSMRSSPSNNSLVHLSLLSMQHNLQLKLELESINSYAQFLLVFLEYLQRLFSLISSSTNTAVNRLQCSQELVSIHCQRQLKIELDLNLCFRIFRDVNINVYSVRLCDLRRPPTVCQFHHDGIPSHLHYNINVWIPHDSIHNAARAIPPARSWLNSRHNRLYSVLHVIHRHKVISVNAQLDGKRHDIFVLRHCFLVGHCVCSSDSARDERKKSTGNWKLIQGETSVSISGKSLTIELSM